MPVSKHIKKRLSNNEWIKKKNKRISSKKFKSKMEKIKKKEENSEAQKRISQLKY